MTTYLSNNVILTANKNIHKPMSTEASRKEIYRQSRRQCDLNKRQWSRLMSLGALDGNLMANVGKKEKPSNLPNSRGVSMSEALAAGLLVYLHNQGKDIQAIEFDSDGNITNIPDLD